METNQELTLPTPSELFKENIEDLFKNEKLNLLLNQEPNKGWIKVHPHIANYKYIPIDKIELMIRRIFKKYSIEITGQGIAFNGVWVTVRVHYFNPATKEMMYHDGIGACQLQLRAQTAEEKNNKMKVAFNSDNINHGALSMAFPIAKTIAIKDACDHFGKLFGCDLNRKDTVPFSADQLLMEKGEQLPKEIIEQVEIISDKESLEKYLEQLGNEYNNSIALKTLVAKKRKQFK